MFRKRRYAWKYVTHKQDSDSHKTSVLLVSRYSGKIREDHFWYKLDAAQIAVLYPEPPEVKVYESKPTKKTPTKGE